MRPFDCLDPSLQLEGYHALEASAGTGKTFAIQHIATRLILQNVSIEDILIVTFTRASTRELKARLRMNLETLFENPPPYLSQKNPVEARFLIDEALALFDQAQIFTIHGFCQRMLTEFGFEAGVGLNLLSEEQDDYRDILIQEIGDFFHTSLHPNAYSTGQLAALMKYCNYNKDILIKKVLSLIEQEGEFPAYPDYQTAKAAYQTLHPNLPKLSLDTLLERAPAFLKICNKEGMLKEEYQAQFQALSSPDHFDLLLKTRPSLFSFFTEENRSRKDFTPEQLEPLYILHQSLHSLIEAAASPQHTLIRIARAAQKKVRQKLLERELFSPDDLLTQMKEALKRPAFAKRIQSRYRAVIIDEFQDTDTHQWDIFKTLFVENPIEAFYIVGDPKQSIYGFRSADLATYFQAKKAMQKTSHLRSNYRSEPGLLSALNALFSEQKHFPYDPVTPALPQDTSFSDDKNPLHFFVASVEKKRERSWPSPAIEAQYFFPFIAREIQTLTQKKEAKYSDFAILVKDRYQAARLKTYLEKLHIPIAAKSTEPLTTTPLYSFFKAFLGALIDPKHIQPLLAHPLLRCTHKQLKTDQTLHQNTIAFCHHLKTLYKTHGFHKALDTALHHQWKPPQTLFELLVQSGQLDPYSDFMQLAELLIEHATQTKPTPSQLLHFLSELPTDKVKYCRRPLADLSAVTIMTIHMSKGLEFPIVFAFGLVSRYTSRQDFIRHQKKWILSSSTSQSQAALQDQESEKLRQLYVALTRAKKRLYVPLLQDTSHKPPALGTTSPLELLFTSLPSLTELLPKINATATHLTEDVPKPLPKKTSVLKPPPQTTYHFPTHHIHSFSSLAKHAPPPSPATPEGALPKGTQTGLLLHTLLEKIIREKFTHPYQKKPIQTLIESATLRTPYHPFASTIIDLIDQAFHIDLGGFTLSDIPHHHLHPETEFLYAQDKTHSIKGFADLIFFHKEAYYVLDWKTNLLENYHEQALETAMEQNEYFLQAKIYQEALRRYLKFKQEPHPVAGAYYLFLRGLPQNQGVYYIGSQSPKMFPSGSAT